MKKALIIGLVAAVLIVIIVLNLLRPQQQPRGLLGEWTTLAAPAPGAGSQKSGSSPVRTRLGFGEKGREVVVVWLTPPHHVRPLPVSTIVNYKVQGATLIQSAPPHTNPFTGLGLAVTQGPAGPALTTHFAIQGNRLILSQPDSGKSVALQLTGYAIPPTGQIGGSGGHQL